MIRNAVTTFTIQQLYQLMNQTFTAGKESSGELSFHERELSLYLHFPFCDAVCRYCPFSRTVNSSDMVPYLESILTELNLLELQGKLNGARITSLFFGGGTPSLIPEEYLRKITNRLKELFPHYDTIQKTMECTPESITSERLQLFEELGFNRLTIGVQSLQQSVLSELGRKETPELIREKLALVTEQWSGTWSCDLIYGFDSHNSEQFLTDIAELIELGTDHISMFPLINSDSKNRQSLPVAQFVKMESMYHQATELLNRSGFTGYSVEDFGKSEESYCHYQSDVWTYPQRDLLILGSGGFGISESVQYRKEKNRTRYIERVQQGEFPLDRFQPISEKRAEKVRPLMGLHYNSVTRTQFPLYPLFRTTGILKREGNRYTLTPRGRFATSLLWAKVMLQRMVN